MLRLVPAFETAEATDAEFLSELQPLMCAGNASIQTKKNVYVVKPNGQPEKTVNFVKVTNQQEFGAFAAIRASHSEFLFRIPCNAWSCDQVLLEVVKKAAPSAERDAILQLANARRRPFQLQDLDERSWSHLHSSLTLQQRDLQEALAGKHYLGNGTMKYISTRGGDKELCFEETVLTGLAPDGGLYIPVEIPRLPGDWQTKWSSLSFQELSLEVLSLYIDPTEISRDELRALVNRSYSTFRHPDITPLRKLSDRLSVLELFHGPTFAFKDVALQLLGNLFEYFLLRRNSRKNAGEARERLTVVGATSGDTGSAAIYGLRNKSDISIFILHPKGRVSPIQEAQMTTVTDDNVHNVAVKGTFDDCQDIVKALFADGEFNKTHRLGAINSINWARILAQTVYYFLAYFHARRQSPPGSDATLQFVVPTGNFGDILAGYYAKRMGLPCARLAVATNENDILARFWRSGRYEKSAPVTAEGAAAPANGASDGKQAAETGGVRSTLSPAMDILVSSNFERLLWYLAFEAAGSKDRVTTSATVAGWMSKVKNDGRVELPVDVLELARRDFVAERISDEQTIETIRSFYKSSPSYIADPHTAVGLAAARIIAKQNPPSTVQIVLSTAHPAKFSEAVTQALANEPQFRFERDVLPEEFKGLLERERRVIDVERPEVNLVKSVIESFADDREAKGSGQATV